MFWEELDFAYMGVIDGHDVAAMRRALREALAAERPVVVHCATVKGKGFAPAEEGGLEGMEQWHAAKPKSIANGVPAAATLAPQNTGQGTPKPAPPAFTQVFGDALVAEARRDDRIVGITAAMNTGTGLNILQRELPDRYYDVGIAEQQAILFASGLALQGVKPVAAIYSTFLQRAFDQIVHDVCLQNLNVVFAMDRAGLVGDDGPTHHGVFDIAYLRPAAQHRADGPARRGDARAHAAHRGHLRRRPDRAALPARQRQRGAAARRAGGAADRDGRDPARGRGLEFGPRGWRCSATAPASARPWRQPRSSRATASRVTVADARFAKPIDVALAAQAGRRARPAGHRRGGRAGRRLRLGGVGDAL